MRRCCSLRLSSTTEIAKAKARLESATQRLQETWHALSPRAQAMCMVYMRRPDVRLSKIELLTESLHTANANLSRLRSLRDAQVHCDLEVPPVFGSRRTKYKLRTKEEKLKLVAKARAYGSVKEAAQQLGVNADHLSIWLKGKFLGDMGAPRPQQLYNKNQRLEFVRRACKDFPSRGAAARAFGIEEGCLKRWMKGHHLGERLSRAQREEIMARVMADDSPETRVRIANEFEVKKKLLNRWIAKRKRTNVVLQEVQSVGEASRS